MTYIDQLKYHEFASNSSKWLKHHQAVNFDIIHNQCRVDKLGFDLKYYQTVTKSYVRSYPETEKMNAIGATRRCKRYIFDEE